jgi:negative regulator of sigma E activity
MSEQEQVSQLSALFDNELPAEQAELVIRRVLKDSSLRGSWGRYALIGACMRGEPISSNLQHADVAGRVRMRLASELEHGQEQAAAQQLPGGARRRMSTFGRGALGGAIAASVAAVSLVVIRAMAPQAADASLQVAQQTQVEQRALATVGAAVPAVANPSRLVAARDTAPPSYTTPVDDSPGMRRVNGPLVNYVVAHSEVAASAVRFSPLSSVMSGSYDLAQDAVEMTAAEVGAYR